ncbi:hypothetical protein [Streptomyces brasiliscabiei]|uniref:hypothetical protein n=1 Tax=Streptomyces brasiliscabiei TaxID=2736302 RepID=UPI0038F7BA85
MPTRCFIPPESVRSLCPSRSPRSTASAALGDRLRDPPARHLAQPCRVRQELADRVAAEHIDGFTA